MGLKLNATNGGGSVELDVPDTVNSDLALTVPATAGEVAVKATDGSVDLGDVNIDSSGRLQVGTTSSTGNALCVVQGLAGNSTEQGVLALRRSANNGNNARIGVIEFADDSNNQAALIEAVGDGAWGTDDHPGRLEFSTTADGTASPTERMRIDSLGCLYVGSDSDYSTTNYTQTSGSGNFLYRSDVGAGSGSLVVSNKATNGWSLAYFNKYAWTSSTDNRYINWYKNGTSLASIALTSAGAVSYGTGSDYRLKENVTGMTDGITRLKQLQPNNLI